MNPIYDDYDEFEFDRAAHNAKRGVLHVPRRSRKSFGRRPRPPRVDDRWAEFEAEDFSSADADDYREFDDYLDSSSNRWR